MASDQFIKRKTVEAGYRFFKEGDEGFHAYLVQSGEIEIIKSIDGKPVLLGTIGEGGIFGEMALVDDQPRMAMARAKVGGAVVEISRDMFREKVAKADPFIRGLLKILVKNIRKYQ